MSNSTPVVAIIGAGFGGLNAARILRNAPVQVRLIDRRNYHLFQPLLYQVATAGVSPEEIAYPIRAIFRNQNNLEFHLQDITSVDLKEKTILTSKTTRILYDYLIIAVGSETSYFGMDSIRLHGYDLKDIDDAEAIRNHVLSMFELANQENDQETRDAMRTFVVVGGGPTGVECAGALSELVRLVLTKDFQGLDVSQVRVILLEKMENLLPGFPCELGRAAVKKLGQKHVEIRLRTAVQDYNGECIDVYPGSPIPAFTLIWAAGVRSESLTDKLGVPQAGQGRVIVQNTLQLRDYSEVFVIGDAAYLEDAAGNPLPMMAPVAIQQSKVAAQNVQNLVANRPLKNFSYRDPGSLATIGRNAAVARIGKLKFHGFIAWLIWLGVHLFWLIGFRNRLLVMINWAWDYLLYDRAIRLITN